MAASVERVEATSVGPKTVELTVRGHELVCDKPEDAGGTDRGPMASEYVLAALASCMTTTTLRIAEIRKVAITGMDAAAEMHFDGDKVTAIRLEVDVRSRDEPAKVRKAVELAGRSCTISKLLAMPVEKEISIRGE